MPSLPTLPSTDHRTTAEDGLLESVRHGDALAFAEVCSRTLPAAHAVARRLVPRAGTEAVLREVYALLWSDPPRGEILERWVRRRCFDAARALLRETGTPPAAPSAHVLLDDLPPPAPAFVDGTEQALATLDPRVRLDLVRAHDSGMPADGLAGAAAATRGLLALADSAAAVPAGGERGAEWVLGLLEPREAAAVAGALAAAAGDLPRALRRGRRRLEGLPPGPDVAARLVAATLSGGAAPALVAVAPGPVGLALSAPHTLEPAPVPPLEPARDVLEPAAGRIGPAVDAAPGPAEPPMDGQGKRRPRRRLLWVPAWLVAIAAAVGAGMLIGRLLLDLGLV